VSKWDSDRPFPNNRITAIDSEWRARENNDPCPLSFHSRNWGPFAWPIVIDERRGTHIFRVGHGSSISIPIPRPTSRLRERNSRRVRTYVTVIDAEAPWVREKIRRFTDDVRYVYA